MRGIRPEYAEPPPNVIPFKSSPRATALSTPAAQRRQAGIEATLDEVDRNFRGGPQDWSAAEPRHLLALYFRLHETVHGIEPLELLEQRTWRLAMVEVAYTLSREFQGDKTAMSHFIAWTWLRERKLKPRSPHYRTGWRRQFSAALVTDYRIALKTGGR